MNSSMVVGWSIAMLGGGFRTALSRLLNFLHWPGEIADLVWLPYFVAALFLGIIAFIVYALIDIALRIDRRWQLDRMRAH
jgi:hypothetical protein